VLLTCVVRSTFQPHLPANLLTCVSSQPSSSASDWSSACASAPVFWPCPSIVSPTLIGNSSFQLCRPIALGLASPFDLPASPSDRLSDLRLLANLPALLSRVPLACAADQPSSPAFEPNLRPLISCHILQLGFAAQPSNLTPTHIGCRTLRSSLPIDLRLASPINLPASFSSELTVCCRGQS